MIVVKYILNKSSRGKCSFCSIVLPFRLKFPGREILLPAIILVEKEKSQLVDFEERIYILIIEKDERHNYLVFSLFAFSL